MFKKAILSTLVVPFALSIQGCTDEQVAVGAAVVGGAVVAGAIVAAAHRPHGGYGGYGGYGGGYYEEHRYYRYGGRYGFVASPDFSENDAIAVPTAVSKDEKVSALVEKYGLSVHGSKVFVSAVDAAQNSDATQIVNLLNRGISETDKQLIASGAMPSANALTLLSKKLKSSKKSTKALLKDVVEQIRQRQ